MLETTRKKCRKCGELTKHERHRKDTGHVLHLLLSLITCGLWLPVWLFVALNNGTATMPYTCSSCGYTKRGGILGALCMAVLLLGCAIGGAILLLD